MDIALIQAPAWGVFGPPVGLAQLSACLKKAGHGSRLYDMNIFLYSRRTERYSNSWAIEQSSFWCSPGNVRDFFTDNWVTVDAYIERIVNANPRLVCISVNVCSRHSAAYIAAILKRRLPDVPVVIGGPPFLVKFNPEDYLNCQHIDIIIHGESEITLPSLVSVLESGGDMSACRGLCFKRGGAIVDTGPRPLIDNLDALPFMDFADTPFDEYDPPGHLGRHISIMASRGCVQQCVFCGPRNYWKGFRSMSGKRIFDEIEYHVGSNPGINHVEFLDLLLNGNMKTLLDLCALMAGSRLKGKLGWHANLIVRKEMTREVFQAMAAAGCKHVTFGIESGSQDVLNAMKKRYLIEYADNALKNAHLAGIAVTCNFMFGFPGESREDFEKTLQFLSRNKKYISIAYPSRTFCTIEPYSYLQEHMGEFDMIANPDHGQYWVSKDGTNTFIERMKRCEEFTSFARSIGVDVGLGLQTSYELDHWLNLGDYYNAIGENKRAAECFAKYLALDPSNASVKNKLERTGSHNEK